MYALWLTCIARFLLQIRPTFCFSKCLFWVFLFWFSFTHWLQVSDLVTCKTSFVQSPTVFACMSTLTASCTFLFLFVCIWTEFSFGTILQSECWIYAWFWMMICFRHVTNCLFFHHVCLPVSFLLSPSNTDQLFQFLWWVSQ